MKTVSITASQYRYKYLVNTFLVCYSFYGYDMCLILQQSGFWSYLQVGYCRECCEAEVFPAKLNQCY